MSFPETMKAIAIDRTGGVDVLEVKDVPFPAHVPQNVVIKVAYGGVNFIDIYYRQGLYPIDTYPLVLGMEASGTVVALPTDETVLASDEYKKRNLQIGSKVSVFYPKSHAEYVSVPYGRVFPLPPSVSLLTGAAATLQGLTAVSLIEEAYPVGPGTTVLIHTVAGGLGLLLAQLCKRAGASLVIGTTSTPAKAAVARANGADYVILYPTENVVERVLELTAGEGVHVVYDGVGKDTFMDNFKLARRKGTLVSVGNASGAVEPIAPLRLAEKNLAILRPTLVNTVYTPEEARYFGDKLHHYVTRGELTINIQQEYSFTTDGTRAAQKELASRGGSTIGKLVYKIGHNV